MAVQGRKVDREVAQISTLLEKVLKMAPRAAILVYNVCSPVHVNNNNASIKIKTMGKLKSCLDSEYMAPPRPRTRSLTRAYFLSHVVRFPWRGSHKPQHLWYLIRSTPDGTSTPPMSSISGN